MGGDSSVLIEYDPYKYNSFPANAGMLAYRLTVANRSRLKEFSEQGKLDQFPRVLAFQSLVDATVSLPDLAKLEQLADRLYTLSVVTTQC